MFISYSWSEFFVFIGVMGLLYFLVVGYAYYKKDMTQFLFSFGKEGLEIPKVPEKTNGLLPMVHELVSELGVTIRHASESKPALPELLFALKQKIKAFQTLELTEYKSKINQYIAEELEIHGMQGVGLEEIEGLWKP